ncbi:hypothetical protein [Burkholderia gladioli]|uniref:hypothetical protein n=1 Tax=Burkholderia gladioli TaxID=28095 RepID=UPI00164141B1|nr:hypothetical protein [Burkholderia gladioli]
MTNNTTAHQDALSLVHEEAGRTLSKSDFDLCMRIAKRALLTSPRAAVPAPKGWKLVPIEATREMADSGHLAYDEHGWSGFKKIWSAMLDAAPAAPVAEAEPIDKLEPTLILTGAQLLEALDLVAPDRTADQFESEVSFQYGNGHSGKGMYCWITDYPDEGASLLDGSTVAAQAFAADGASDFSAWLATKSEAWWEDTSLEKIAADAWNASRAAVSPATADKRATWLRCTVLEIADECGISGEALARLAHIIDTRDVALLHKLTTPIVQTLRASQATAPDDVLGALKALVKKCDGPEGVRADGSNIDTSHAHGVLESTPAAAPQAATASEREAFEAWAIGETGGWCQEELGRAPAPYSNLYTEDRLNDAWEAWQASAAQAAAPADAREPLVLWKDGTGMLWDTYSHGKWMHRVVSPHGWDAHGVAQHLYGKGYAGHLEVRAVWSGNYAVPADAGDAREPIYQCRLIKTAGWNDVSRTEFDACATNPARFETRTLFLLPADAGEAVAKPRDCSGTPESCPDNEGYGFHCSDGTRAQGAQGGKGGDRG